MPQIVYSVVEKDSNMIWTDHTFLWIWYGGNVSTRAEELREAAARSAARRSALANVPSAGVKPVSLYVLGIWARVSLLES